MFCKQSTVSPNVNTEKILLVSFDLLSCYLLRKRASPVPDEITLAAYNSRCPEGHKSHRVTWGFSRMIFANTS